MLTFQGLYLAGSPFINRPWAADSYSPLDLTLLDHHFGNITAWREAITETHSRGMYVIMDNTMSTLGDLIGEFNPPYTLHLDRPAKTMIFKASTVFSIRPLHSALLSMMLSGRVIGDTMTVRAFGK
jgi:hypothetical protein